MDYKMPAVRVISNGTKKTLLVSAIAIAITGCSVTPAPLQQTEINQRVQADLDIVSQTLDPITQTIDLNQAIARALKHNRERRLQAMEAVLAQGQIELDQFDMLPQLTAAAGYTQRDTYAASASTTFDGNNPAALPANPSYSVSQDKSSTNANIAFSWNVLDFGLSYVRAQQQADRYLIAKERERKVVHNIVQDVRNAYYRATSAERLLQKIDLILQQTQQALRASRIIEQTRARTPIEALNYQRELLENLRTLQTLRQDLITAKTELATLMGLTSRQKFELADVRNPSYQQPKVQIDMTQMEQAALILRPELIETQYQKRISAKEARSAMLSLLPGINLSAGIYYDNSDYLKYNDWTSAGAQISGNLLNVFKAGKINQVAELKQDIAHQQALATAVTVLSQVHMASAKYQEAQTSFQIADEYYQVALRIQDQVRSARDSNSRGELELIRENLGTLLAELRRDVAYAELQNSFGRVMVSMGLDAVPSGFKDKPLHELTQAIGQNLNQWNQGKLILPEINPQQPG